jgi:hypothetical protein
MLHNRTNVSDTLKLGPLLLGHGKPTVQVSTLLALRSVCRNLNGAESTLGNWRGFWKPRYATCASSLSPTSRKNPRNGYCLSARPFCPRICHPLILFLRIPSIFPLKFITLKIYQSFPKPSRYDRVPQAPAFSLCSPSSQAVLLPNKTFCPNAKPC